MSPDQILYLLEMAHRDDSVDELKWRFPDEDWASAEMQLAAMTKPDSMINGLTKEANETVNLVLKTIYEPSITEMLTSSSPYTYWVSPKSTATLVGIGDGGSSTSTAGTYLGIERSTVPMFSSKPPSI